LSKSVKSRFSISFLFVGKTMSNKRNDPSINPEEDHVLRTLWNIWGRRQQPVQRYEARRCRRLDLPIHGRLPEHICIDNKVLIYRLSSRAFGDSMLRPPLLSCLWPWWCYEIEEIDFGRVEVTEECLFLLECERQLRDVRLVVARPGDVEEWDAPKMLVRILNTLKGLPLLGHYSLFMQEWRISAPIPECAALGILWERRKGDFPSLLSYSLRAEVRAYAPFCFRNLEIDQDSELGVNVTSLDTMFEYRRQWKRLAALLAFQRANRHNPLVNSILPLLTRTLHNDGSTLADFL
jgi:hypothetical protein